MKLSFPTKILLSMATVFFVGGVFSLSFTEIKADVKELKMVMFHQQGYSGIPHGTSRGSSTRMAIALYEYKIDSETFTGTGLAHKYDGESVLIKYFPRIPSLSVSSSTPYFLVSGYVIPPFITEVKSRRFRPLSATV